MAHTQTHFRSISLPSRFPSISSNFETQIEKIKSLQVSANSEAIQSTFMGIAEMYNSVQEMRQSQQRSVVSDGKSMEESLSNSVDLLDSCSSIRELVQMMRENVQALQSALRRKGLVQNDVAAYLCCRKKMDKSIDKTLKTLKKSEHMMRNNIGSTDSNFHCVFTELTGITTAVFKTILLFLSFPTTGRATGGWSLVSKMMMAKSGKENGAVSEVEDVDFAVRSLQGKMRSDGARVLDVQKKLQNLDAVIEGFEGGLERLFRQLVQIRVTLLNFLTDH